jgi:anti-sigma B factor antagonist
MASETVETVPVGADARLVVARGELDFYSSPAFRADLLAALEAVETVVVDLTEVTFIDSTALGTLVGAARRLRGRGRLAIACGDPHVARTLELTGIDRLVRVFPTVSAAFTA